jgi:hypothetical protein
MSSLRPAKRAKTRIISDAAFLEVLAPFVEFGDGDRPGVDHRVEGPVVLVVEDDRVEGLAGRLDPDACAGRRRVPCSRSA